MWERYRDPLDTTSSSRTGTAASLLVIFFVFFFIIFTYTTLHEAGHALVGLLSGGRLTSFSIDFITFGAHAGIQGEFTTAQQALIAVSGVGLPLVVWTAFLLLVPPAPRDPVLARLLLVGTAGVNGSLLAWVIVPLVLLAGGTARDDSANFIRLTGVHPLLVAAAALLVIAGGVGLYLRRSGGLRQAVGTMRTPLHKPGDSPTLWAMGVVLVFMAALAGGAGLLVRETREAAVPAGYEQAFSIECSGQAHREDVIYTFQLDGPARASFFFVFDDFKHGPLKLALTGPDGPVFIFMEAGEVVEIGHATINPQPLQLDEGAYEIRLTAPQEPSRLQGYVSFK
jgi:hypothetical protein